MDASTPTRPPRRRLHKAASIIAGVAVVGLSGWGAFAVLSRATTEAPQVTGARLLRDVSLLVHHDAAGTKQGLVDLPRLLLDEPELLAELEEHFASSRGDPREPRSTIGGAEIGALARNPELRASVKATLPRPTDEWVQIGDMFIWQRAEPRLSYDAALVVGYETQRSGWNVVYADSHVAFVTPDPTTATPEFIERDARSRAKYGQPPLPAEWFTLPPRR